MPTIIYVGVVRVDSMSMCPTPKKNTEPISKENSWHQSSGEIPLLSLLVLLHGEILLGETYDVYTALLGENNSE